MQTRRAFTLVELLVVIAIIALLLAILMPVLSKVKNNARRLVCSSRIKQNIVAINVVANDRNGKLPTAGNPLPEADFDDAFSLTVEDYFNIGSVYAKIPGGYSVGELQGRAGVSTKVREITDKLDAAGFKKIFDCPELSLGQRDAWTDGWGRKTSKPFVCKLGAYWIVRLGYCYVGGFRTNTSDPDIQPGDAIPWKSPRTVADAGYLPLLTDQTLSIPGYNAWSPNNSFTAAHGPGYISKSITPGTDVRKNYGNTSTNVGTVDGSVQCYKLSETQPRQICWIPIGAANAGVAYNYWP